MKVLYIIDSLVPAGAERSLAAMAPLLVERGVALDVAYLKEVQGLQQEIRDAGAGRYSLAGSGGRAGWTLRCRRLVAMLRPDLVHTTLFESDVAGRTAARLCGVPVVTSLVGINYGPEQLMGTNLKRWKLRGAQLADAGTARAARRFHAISEHVAATMAPRLRISRSRIDVIPRGRDPRSLGARTHERRARARDSLQIEPTAPLVLAAARHEYPKGLDVLLRAAPLVLARHQDARFLIAGRSGAQTANLRALASELDIADAAIFLGPRDDVPDLLTAADVFVSPSRWEGLGGVVLEAMALQAPIVASSLPPTREMLDNDSALLVPSEDPASLAEGILRTLEEKAESRDRTDAAKRRFMERFTLDRVVDRMLSFYEGALAA